MRRRSLVLAVFASLPLMALSPHAGRQDTFRLLNQAGLKPTSAETTAIRDESGVNVSIAPGKDGYPGLSLTPTEGAWDLSRYGHVEARLVNTGAKPIILALRVDNAGNWQDNPWNTESVTLQPGEKGTLRTIFGYQYGRKKGFKLNPAKVVNVLVFTPKSNAPQSFRIESLEAGGPAHETPPVVPDDIRIKPKNGEAFDLKGLSMDGAFTRDAKGKILLSGKDAAGRIRPKEGRWDLRGTTAVWLTVRNAGNAPVVPIAKLETNGGGALWSSMGVRIPPGKQGEVCIPFGHPIDLSVPGTVDDVTSDAVGAVVLQANGATKLELQSIRTSSGIEKLPAWVGKRPPVPGEWTKTLDDEFSGTRLDQTVWKATGENYYDKQSHWSKDNVIVKDGTVRLRYEKKTGYQNDDPKRDKTAYASGYLDTFGLWKQRYGYFEARMKLPAAPGLWPAFWMMPDRSSKEGREQWKRQDTAHGGMEFDIMEHLTRWGPHRYNIAMHYDGYGTDHKMPGSDKVYAGTDKDGFITCGLLWTPGEAVYYCNGYEVLRWKNPRISNVPSIFMFTLPTGGWDNDALDDDRLPAKFIIDYVRVWQRKDLASPVDGKQKDPQS